MFALPGKIDSGNSFGTNELIKQGAKLVSNIEDILEELNLVGQVSCAKDRGTERGSYKIEDLTNEESVLYNTLSQEPQHLDDIVDKIGLTTAKTLSMLLALEIKKCIHQLPGKQFARVTNA